MKHLVIFFLLFIFNSFQIFAQTPNFSGNWRLNFEKSKLEDPPNGLTSSLFIIHQNGDHFKLTRYHIFKDKSNKISFKMLSDGKTRRVKILFKGKLEPTTNGLKASLWRKNFSNVVDYTFGSNNNQLIADEVYNGIPKNHHNIWVFDREVMK